MVPIGKKNIVLRLVEKKCTSGLQKRKIRSEGHRKKKIVVHGPPPSPPENFDRSLTIMCPILNEYNHRQVYYITELEKSV